jgi:hypothetical protein
MVMPEAEHIEYYRRRAATEHELAATAPNKNISQLHSEMAAYYEKLVLQPERRNKLNIVIDQSGHET